MCGGGGELRARENPTQSHEKGTFLLPPVCPASWHLKERTLQGQS